MLVHTAAAAAVGRYPGKQLDVASLRIFVAGSRMTSSCLSCIRLKSIDKHHILLSTVRPSPADPGVISVPETQASRRVAYLAAHYLKPGTFSGTAPCSSLQGGT